MAKFTGKNYSIEATNESQFLLIHPTEENDLFDSFEELVESYPVCEESRSFFFDNDDSDSTEIAPGIYESNCGIVFYSNN